MAGKDSRKAKRTSPQPARRREEPSLVPPPPLDWFSADRLARFFELAFTPGELLSLCREVGAQPKGGYRLEKLDPAERCRLLAGDYFEKPRIRPTVEAATVGALKSPALRSLWLPAKAASELGQLLAGDPVSAQARLAWRCIGDGDPAVRAVAEQAIDHGMSLLERIADDAERPQKPQAKAPSVDEQVAAVGKQLQHAEKDRDAARAQLQQARTEIAERDRRLNELKQESTLLRVEAAAQVAELSRLNALQSTDERRGATELRKLSAQNAHLEGRVEDFEERLSAQTRRSAELERSLAERDKPPLNLPPGDSPHAEASAHEFVTPLFTDEFYASVERWDRRVVKVAFEKALMLAKDHRHPSLRALPLTGVENLFRIRIASDVRLIYRRGDDCRLEILSLLDREDLDRYVRQSRTRLAKDPE